MVAHAAHRLQDDGRRHGERVEREDRVEAVEARAPEGVEGGEVVACLPGGEVAQGEFGGVGGAFLHDRVEEAVLKAAAAPPREFVVDEVAEEPRVFAVGGTFEAGAVAAEGLEVGVEDVGEGGAGAVLVGGDVVFVAEGGEVVAAVEDLGVDEAAVLERGAC